MANSANRPQLNYWLVINHFFTATKSGRRTHDSAFREFLDIVNPDERKLDSNFNALFAEWFLFDYRYKRGKSPLAHFLDYHPLTVDARELDEFRQSAETHFCSNFLVVGAVASREIVLLEDLATGNRLEVRDKSMSRSLGKTTGLLGARLVRVDGSWYFAGNPVYFYPTVMSDEAKRLLRETHDKETTFVDLVKSHYGMRGEDPETQAFFTPPSPKSADKREARVRELEGEYETLRKQFGLKTSWEDVKKTIRCENSSQGPADILKDLLANESGIIPLDTQDDLMKVASIFFEAWNLLPHDSLGGMPPAERTR